MRRTTSATGVRRGRCSCATCASVTTSCAVRGSYAASDAAAEGSFANAELDVVVTQHEGEERARVTGRRELKKLLMEAGLDDAAAEADVDALHAGRVLVLVHIAAIPKDEVRAVLDGAVRAS